MYIYIIYILFSLYSILLLTLDVENVGVENRNHTC